MIRKWKLGWSLKKEALSTHTKNRVLDILNLNLLYLLSHTLDESTWNKTCLPMTSQFPWLSLNWSPKPQNSSPLPLVYWRKELIRRLTKYFKTKLIQKVIWIHRFVPWAQSHLAGMVEESGDQRVAKISNTTKVITMRKWRIKSSKCLQSHKSRDILIMTLDY